MSEAASKEPSMEDILASIRRIVSQDDSLDDSAPSPEPRAAAPAPKATSTPDSARSPSMSAMPSQRSAGSAYGAPPRERPSPAPARPSPPSFTSRPAAETSSFARFAREVAEEMRSAPPAPQPSYRREETPRVPFGGSAATARSAPNASAHSYAPSTPSAPTPSARLDRRAEDRPSSAATPRPQAPRAPMPATTSSAGQRLAEHKPSEPRVSDQKPTDLRSAERRPAPTSSAQTASAASSAVNEREVEAFRGALTSPGSESAVRSSLDRLKRGVNNDLDAKVEAVLRPMLREWLDDNLPKLVERLVRDEIERLAGKN